MKNGGRRSVSVAVRTAWDQTRYFIAFSGLLALAVALMGPLKPARAESPASLGRSSPLEAPPKERNGKEVVLEDAVTAVPAPPAIRRLVLRLAPIYGLNPDLVLAVIALESDFNPNEVSSKNARGLMQLIPETAERFDVSNPYDAEQNVRGGIKYLRWLLAFFDGDVTLALAGYNAGEGAVLRHKGIPPYRETRRFIAGVRRLYAERRHPYDRTVAESSGLSGAREEVAVLPP